MIKKCSICGEDFETARSITKYCSRRCRQDAKNRCTQAWRKKNPEKNRERRERENERRRKLKPEVQSPPPFLVFRGKPRTKTCSKCGEKFTTEHHNAKTCPACRQKQLEAILRHEQTKRQLVELTHRKCAKAEGKPVKSLDDWAREARECNLDYGTYRALLAQGKTFDELKAQAQSRHTPAHAHSHKGGNWL